MDRDIILNFVIHLIVNNAHFHIPLAIWLLAVWRAATLRSLRPDNYREKVPESVSDTLKEQLATDVFPTLFAQNNVDLPPNKTAGDILEILVQNTPNDVALLSQIYDSMLRFGAESPFFTQMVEIISALM